MIQRREQSPNSENGLFSSVLTPKRIASIKFSGRPNLASGVVFLHKSRDICYSGLVTSHFQQRS
jgi:hypothetical protein